MAVALVFVQAMCVETSGFVCLVLAAIDGVCNSGFMRVFDKQIFFMEAVITQRP